MLGAAMSAWTACGGGSSGNVTVAMTDALKFSPDHVTIPRGGTVTWKNTSRIPHTSTADPSLAVNKSDVALPAGAQLWDSGLIESGKRWSHRFDVPGAYTYFCVPHETAGMVGHITVEG
jgi:plastocyanin